LWHQDSDFAPDAFGAPPTDPYASPLLHSRIKELNNVYLAVAGHDTLRDDGLLFKQKLDDNKYGPWAVENQSCTADNSRVPNKLDFYEGYPHFFWMWPSAKLEVPRKEFYANLAKGVQFVIS
jgi:versiconal hemiacetal acetate esterase